MSAPRAHAEARPFSNASAADLQSITELCASLSAMVTARDAGTLRFYGVANVPEGYPFLAAQTRISHVAATRAGALVKEEYRVTASPDSQSAGFEISRGVHELWLNRAPKGGFAFSTKYWTAAPAAVAGLVDAAQDEWNALAEAEAPARTATVPKTAVPQGGLLHLVAELRGGRWIALRRSRWDGSILDGPRLEQQVRHNGTRDVGEWLQRQMARFTTSAPGTAHFILQRGQSGWVGLDTIWEKATRVTREQENMVNACRQQLQGAMYLSASGHRDLAQALGEVGLYAEGADEMEKADCLQPGIIDATQLRDAQTWRVHDPAAQTVTQLQNEAKVGLGAEHPTYVISALAKVQQTQPTVLGALRIGLEYSKLADDVRADQWLDVADGLLRRNGPNAAGTGDDAAWIKVLYDHLKERGRIASLKPPNIIRSALFTVRCWPNEWATLPVLAALESAQHTVYSGFGIPMGSTEVVVWRTQADFQQYTTAFAQQGISEFVAALTLTKLISTQQGPLVLGEEVNVFVDSRTNTFSTLAHEYGHVAVRQLSRGRLVPVWFNEGIAAAVEGGYEGYVPRVRRAAQAGELLTMAEMQEWDVDAERAFLAYSQANSIVDYIVAQPGWGRNAVLEILRRIGRDTPPEEAFRGVLGIGTQELWNRWSKTGIR